MKEGGLCIVFTAIAISLPPSLPFLYIPAIPLTSEEGSQDLWHQKRPPWRDPPSLSSVRTLGRTLGGGSELSSSLMVIWRSRTFDDP